MDSLPSTLKLGTERELSLDAAAYLDEVYAYASRRLPCREEAEDATAETFAAAYAGWVRRPDGDPRLWLLAIARRKIADAMRRRARRRETPLPDDLPAGDHPGRSLERADAARRIRVLVLALPEDQREALMLQRLESLEIAEIATVMGRSPAAINSLLQRARARLLREGSAYFLERESRP